MRLSEDKDECNQKRSHEHERRDTLIKMAAAFFSRTCLSSVSFNDKFTGRPGCWHNSFARWVVVRGLTGQSCGLSRQFGGIGQGGVPKYGIQIPRKRIRLLQVRKLFRHHVSHLSNWRKCDFWDFLAHFLLGENAHVLLNFNGFTATLHVLSAVGSGFGLVL